MKNALRVIAVTLLCIAFFAAAVATYVAVSQNYPTDEFTEGGLQGAFDSINVVTTILILILGEFEVLRLLIFPFCSRRNDRRLLIINVLTVAFSLFMVAFELGAVFGPVPEGEWIALLNILLILVFRVYYYVLARRSKPEQST